MTHLFGRSQAVTITAGTEIPMITGLTCFQGSATAPNPSSHPQTTRTRTWVQTLYHTGTSRATTWAQMKAAHPKSKIGLAKSGNGGIEIIMRGRGLVRPSAAAGKYLTEGAMTTPISEEVPDTSELSIRWDHKYRGKCNKINCLILTVRKTETVKMTKKKLYKDKEKYLTQ
jgi:hypothetical protein